ncbi:MAG: SIS domain-containing protein [Bacteroidetes bacterium]|nr:SIS domain-containing protein [Bacteroidota bacterium]
MVELIKEKILSSIQLKTELLNHSEILNKVNTCVIEIINCYKNNGKVFWCGNGGSAADAQHLAAELSGRFYYDRAPLYSEALHVNTSYITAVANDYSYDVIYSRLVKAMVNKNDVLIGLTTSGNSTNIINAINEANSIGACTIAFTGLTGGKLKDLPKHLINIPSTDTPRIQECHMLLGHTICELVEKNIFPKNN